MESVGAYDFKTHPLKLIERVSKGERITITKQCKKRLKAIDSVRFITLISQLPIIAENESPERTIKDLSAFAGSDNLSSFGAIAHFTPIKHL